MKRSLIALILFFLAVTASLSGCAFGKFGRADMTFSRISVPDGLEGRDKEHILKTLGVPSSVVHAGDDEYWDYNNKCGFFVLIFGKNIENDLILDFRDGKVASSYLVDKGSSTGILADPGAIAR